MVALFYTLSFGFAAGSDRTLQAFLEGYVEMADCDELSYTAFHNWFEPGFVALLREIFDDAIETLDIGRADLNGRLERFRDGLIVDATVLGVFQERFPETAFPRERWANTFRSVAQLILEELAQSFGYPPPNLAELMFRDARQPENSRLLLSERVAEAFMRPSNA